MHKSKKKLKKVLIVEDDSLLVRVLYDTFVSEKFDVQTVENGLEVQDIAKKFSPDMILLDLIIPGIDGFEVLRRLKSKESTRKIPVVILSNIDEIGDVKAGRTLGADEYFIKANVEIEKIVAYVKDKLYI